MRPICSPILQEIHLLFEDLLIEVTNFFRNPEAFESLKQTLRKSFFAPRFEKGGAQGVGNWLLQRRGGLLHRYCPPRADGRIRLESQEVQILGSDINESAVNIARTGEYPLAITEDVDVKRLEKFFIKQDNGYKVRKEVREMVVFVPMTSSVTRPSFTLTCCHAVIC